MKESRDGYINSESPTGEVDVGELAASRLRGLAVMAAGARGKLGEVVDLLTRPTEGIALGLILRTNAGEEWSIAWRDFEIRTEGVAIPGISRLQAEDLRDPLASGVKACGELVGVHVVTEEGRLLGRVREVYVNAETGRLSYGVAESKWRQFIGGGGYIAGDLPRAYSRLGHRLIVPAGAELSHASSSPGEPAGASVRKLALTKGRLRAC